MLMMLYHLPRKNISIHGYWICYGWLLKAV